MSKRIAMLIARCTLAVGTLALSTFALAQDDADIAPRFRNTISPEQYHQLRDQYLNLLRGLPADPRLREAAVRTLQVQLTAARQNTAPNVFNPSAWTSIDAPTES